MRKIKDNFDEKESLVVALLYIEDELRRCGMKLSEQQLRKTIKTAKNEIENRPQNDDTQIVKKCLETALGQKNTALLNAIQNLTWHTSGENNDNKEETDLAN